MGNKIQFTDEQILDIIKLYTEELRSPTDISLKYNCCVDVIVNRLLTNGVNVVKGSPFSINYWIKRGMTNDDAVRKIKQMKPVYIEYWVSRGYSEEEAKFQIELHLMNTERAFVHVYGQEEGITKFRDIRHKQGKLNSNRCIDYWESRGYSKEEARQQVSKHQSTFNLDKCIQKYGEIDGKKRWEERQNKWQQSLQSNPDIVNINKRKDSGSIKYYKNKYGVNWTDEYFKRTPEIPHLKEIINTCETKDDVLTYFNNYIPFNIPSINLIIKSRIFINKFNENTKDLFHEILLLYDVKLSNTYGTQRTIGGYLTQSTGEYEIMKFLIASQLPFEYDQRYPTELVSQNYKRYDFYLPDIDVYFEYTGMLNLAVKNNQRDKKIKDAYKISLQTKTEICRSHNLKCYFSNNHQDIINQIKYEYEKKNNPK